MIRKILVAMLLLLPATARAQGGPATSTDAWKQGRRLTSYLYSAFTDPQLRLSTPVTVAGVSTPPPASE